MRSRRSTRSAPAFEILVERRSRRVPIRSAEIRAAARTVLACQKIVAAEISVAIVSDDEIHRVNREHLTHDFPTDVISFLYASETLPDDSSSSARHGRSPRRIEGEIVISADTAAWEGPRHRWDAKSELLLYLVHGLLHLCGYDDLSPALKRVMRREERTMLQRLGIESPRRPK